MPNILLKPYFRGFTGEITQLDETNSFEANYIIDRHSQIGEYIFKAKYRDFLRGTEKRRTNYAHFRKFLRNYLFVF